MSLALPAGADDLDFYLGRSFDNTSKTIVTLGIMSTFAAHPYDEEVRSQWRLHQQMSKPAAHTGDLLGSGVPGAFIALTQYFYDRDNGVAHIKSMIGSGVYTSSLKVIANRQRPGNSTNRLSFPSGHTSSSFATASALAYAYGYKAGIPAYLIATFVATSRLSDDVHFLSDTVAGATIGIWMGYAYAANLNAKPKGFAILPSVQDETYFINLLAQF